MGVKAFGGGGQAPVNEPLGRQTQTALVETMLVAVTENETAELTSERGVEESTMSAASAQNLMAPTMFLPTQAGRSPC